MRKLTTAQRDVIMGTEQDAWQIAARAAGWVRRHSHFSKGGVSIAYIDWKTLCLSEGIASSPSEAEGGERT